VYEGKDPYWSPIVEKAAEAQGFKASEQGKMIKPENYTSVESELRDSLLRSFESLEGKSIHDFSPIPAK
jgi:hypothetical protein